MEKLSTNKEAFINRLKEELLDYTHPVIFTYYEIGQLLTHAYSISYSKINGSVLRGKVWNAAYDNSRFNLGIFNLDRIAITQHDIEMTPSEREEIAYLSTLHHGINASKGVILDGLSCGIEIDDSHLKWNVDASMSNDLTKLVRLIRKKANNILIDP